MSQPLSLAYGSTAPRPGSRFIANKKLSPRAGKVDTNECEWPKGECLKAAKCRELSPLSFAYAQQLPRKRWSLLVQCKLVY